MQLTSDAPHRCLSYIASVQRHGYKLDVRQFAAYAAEPDRRKPRNLGMAAFQEAIRRGKGDLSGLLGKAATDPGESMLDYLYRLDWITIESVRDDEEFEDDDRVLITELGRAVLASLEEETAEEELPAMLVLDQGDPVAKGRLIGEIARAGECALIDPYFSLDDLLGILQRTEVKRVLTGSGDRPKLAALGQAIGDLALPRPFEVRVSGAFHDRFVIPTDGHILQVGTSLTGVGKRLSVAVRLDDDDAAAAIRQAFEAAWAEAEPLEPPSAPSAEDDQRDSVS